MNLCKRSISSRLASHCNSEGESSQVSNQPVWNNRFVNIVRGQGQYVFDSLNNQYLDCINSVAHVGHCHPAVVEATINSLASRSAALPNKLLVSEVRYPTLLRDVLPSYINSFLFCNSGTEAVDLALQLAKLHTKGTDVVCVDNTFHGATESVCELSSKVSSQNRTGLCEWVHFIPQPYIQNDRKVESTCDASLNTHVGDVVEKIQKNNRKIACFICEPLLVVSGCISPPKKWLQEIYRLIKDAGGLCIADEVQTGFGRIGSHFWSFEAQEVIPDIIIIGKSIGNGYPLALVATNEELASLLGDRRRNYQCSPIVDSLGCSVLNVLKKEKLMEFAATLGFSFKIKLKELRNKHFVIGDVRGSGLLFGIEIVNDKESKLPAMDVAEEIVKKLIQRKILVANEGLRKNILLFMPPMCFSIEDMNNFIASFDDVLNEIEKCKLQEAEQHTSQSRTVNDKKEIQNCGMPPIGRLGIFQIWQRDAAEYGSPTPSDVSSSTMNISYDDPD